MSITLKGLTIVKALKALADGSVTSVELVATLIKAIEASQATIHAYISIDAESALAQAKVCDELRAKGSTLPLLGIPIAIKDNINVKGQPCNAASKILDGYISPYDATVIKNLREAGVIFLGRTNMDEFALGSSTETSYFGPTENPIAKGCIPGGSSGGSAAAVAADLAICALGTDTGGSIRQPASHCGIVGLKPTYGLVSRAGVVACASSLDQVGPMTKTVEDAAILLSVLAGHDPTDSTSKLHKTERYTLNYNQTDLVGKTIGIPTEYFESWLDPEVKTIIETGCKRLEALGAKLKPISLPHTAVGIPTYYICMTAEISANLARYDGVKYGLRVPTNDSTLQYKKTRAIGFGREVKRRILLGTFVLSSGYYEAYYNKALKVRSLISQDFNNAFKECDVLYAPVCPTPAWTLGEFQNDPIKNYSSDILTVGVNLAGCCSLAVPVGLTSSGKPVGAQFIGPNFSELNLCNIAKVFSTI